MAFGRLVESYTAYRIAPFSFYYTGRLAINLSKGMVDGIARPIHVSVATSDGNGAFLSTTGVWINASSRTFKERFQPIDGQALLARISHLPSESWEYKNAQGRHIGPTAEDLVGAFEVGDIREYGTREDKYLSPADIAGAVLLGVKELSKENQELKQAIEQSKRELAKLKGR